MRENLNRWIPYVILNTPPCRSAGHKIKDASISINLPGDGGAHSMCLSTLVLAPGSSFPPLFFLILRLLLLLHRNTLL